MRYVCLKTIVSTIFDGELKDKGDIDNLLSLLCEKELTCSMQVKSGPLHEAVRILNVDSDTITWQIIQNGTSLRKKSAIADILLIRVQSSNELMVHKPEPSRWSTIDTSDI